MLDIVQIHSCNGRICIKLETLKASLEGNYFDLIYVITSGHFLTGSHVLILSEPERNSVPFF